MRSIAFIAGSLTELIGIGVLVWGISSDDPALIVIGAVVAVLGMAVLMSSFLLLDPVS